MREEGCPGGETSVKGWLGRRPALGSHPLGGAHPHQVAEQDGQGARLP